MTENYIHFVPKQRKTIYVSPKTKTSPHISSPNNGKWLWLKMMVPKVSQKYTFIFHGKSTNHCFFFSILSPQIPSLLDAIGGAPLGAQETKLFQFVVFFHQLFWFLQRNGLIKTDIFPQKGNPNPIHPTGCWWVKHIA